jgi:hypothetical protein
MGFDIRLPIGVLFSFLGLLLVGYGVLSDPAIYAHSLGINVNLGWGIVLLAFGTSMLALWRRSARRARSAPAAP